MQKVFLKQLHFSFLLSVCFTLNQSQAQTPELLDSLGVNQTSIKEYRGSHIFNSKLYFITCGDDERGSTLWESDGTVTGTRVLKVLEEVSSCYSYNAYFQSTSYRMYFAFYNNNNIYTEWTSDGTENGTYDLNLPFLTSVNSVIYKDTLYYFSDQADGIFKVSGLANDTVKIHGVIATSGYPVVYNNKMYFSGGFDHELWESDGTNLGTKRVIDIVAGASSHPRELTVFNDSLYFTAHYVSSQTDRKLFKSGGDSASTHEVYIATVPVDGPTNPTHLRVGTNKMYFSASSFMSGQGTGNELWVTDGTIAGTAMVKDLFPSNAESADPEILLVSSSDNVYFNATDGFGTSGFYMSDGTNSGTNKLVTGTIYSNVFENNGDIYFLYGNELFKNNTDTKLDFKNQFFRLMNFYNNKIFVSGADFDSDNGGYKNAGYLLSDGTVDGTVNLGFITKSMSGSIYELKAVNDELYYRDAFDYGTTHSDGKVWNTGFMYRSDGITELQLSNLTELNGKTYGSNGTEIWQLDSDASNTKRIWLKDDNGYSSVNIVGTYKDKYLVCYGQLQNTGIYPIFTVDITSTDTLGAYTETPHPNRAYEIFEIGDYLYFKTRPGGGIEVLWRWKEGNASASEFIHEHAYIEYITVYDDKLFMWSDNKLLKVTGLAVDSILADSLKSVYNITSTSLGLMFVAEDDSNGYQVWISDGTNAGTKMLKKIAPKGFGWNTESGFVEMNGKVYFSAPDTDKDFELWMTDGTEGGTQLVKDIYPGAESSSPKGITVAGDKLYFSANSPDKGRELWESDGTATGTKLVYEFRTGTAPSYFDRNAVLRDEFYFVAMTDSTYGIYKLGSVGTGLEQITQHKFNVNVFPNPTSDGTFSLELNQDKNYTIQVYNQLGQLVITLKSELNRFTTVNLNKEPNGTYIVLVNDNNANIQAGKLVYTK